VPAAWGRLGECQLQLEAWDLATNAFNACIIHPLAEVSWRSRAEVGLGLALEKKAATLPPEQQGPLLDAARDRYHNVLYSLNLKDGEEADPIWLQQSCVYAANLAARRRDSIALR
jgi:hypothetical protein